MNHVACLSSLALLLSAIPGYSNAGMAYFSRTYDNAVVAVEMDTGIAVDEFDVELPLGVVLGGGWLWVRSFSSVLVLDPVSGGTVGEISGFRYVSDMVYQGDRLWIADYGPTGGLTAIDPTSFQKVFEIPVRFGHDLEVADEQLLLASPVSNCLWRIDPRTGAVLEKTRCMAGPNRINYAGEGIVYWMSRIHGLFGRISIDTGAGTTTTAVREETFALSFRVQDMIWDQNRGMPVVTDVERSRLAWLDYEAAAAGGALVAEAVPLESGTWPFSLALEEGTNRLAVAQMASFEGAILQNGQIATLWTGRGVRHVYVGAKVHGCSHCGEADHGAPPKKGLVFCHQHDRWHPKDHALFGAD